MPVKDAAKSCLNKLLHQNQCILSTISLTQGFRSSCHYLMNGAILSQVNAVLYAKCLSFLSDIKQNWNASTSNFHENLTS